MATLMTIKYPPVTASTTVKPSVTNYFAANVALVSGGTTIASTSFTDDGDDPVTGNLVVAATDNGFYSLFIDGAPQESEYFTVAANGADVTLHNGTVTGTKNVTLVVTNFAPTTTVS